MVWYKDAQFQYIGYPNTGYPNSRNIQKTGILVMGF
jgi:hypothetical protein